MKVAIALCQDHVSPRLDCADRLMVVEVAEGAERSRDTFALAEWPAHGRAVRLARLGIDALVCGAVSRFDKAGFDDAEIELIAEVRGPLEEVVAAALSGSLASNRDYWPPTPTPR